MATLEVVDAGRSSSRARPLGSTFDLPPGARARLVEPGAPVRLRCAVVPPLEAVVASLASSPLLEVVEPGVAEVRLVQGSDARWSLLDSVHLGTGGAPALFTLRAGEIDRARAILKHYFRYVLPLRMAALCTDLAGSLRISLLSSQRAIDAAEAQRTPLPEAGVPGAFPCELVSGDRVCALVCNSSARRLRVTLLNSASSGRVQFLGDTIIDAGARYRFWSASGLGQPFCMKPPPGASQGIDRLVAIGTTALARNLGYLRVDTGFADIGLARGATRDMGEDDDGPPVEEWTAAQRVVMTRTRP